MNKNIKQILKENNLGIKLDIGCGANKQKGFVGMDFRALEGVDIVHNLEQFPYPLPDNSVSFAVASHVLEHIKPTPPDSKLVALINLLEKKKILNKKEIRESIGDYDHTGTFIKFMDEVWRILKPEGQFAFVVPYAGSAGYWQDPSHINPITEATIAYFDPEDKSGLWRIYKTKPWKILQNTWMSNGNLECLLEKRNEEIYEKK